MENQICGEYWSDFSDQSKQVSLTIRQACNSVIHAKTILPYKIPTKEENKTLTRIYRDRITVKSTRGKKKTHAEIDIVEFVWIINTLIDSFEVNIHADK